MRTSHWTSERPVPVAGFNLGAYVEARATAGRVEIAAYGSHGVEKDFPKVRAYRHREATAIHGAARA